MPASIYEALAVSPELRSAFLRDWTDAEMKYDAARQAATSYTWDQNKGMVSHLDNPKQLRDSIFAPLQEKWSPEVPRNSTWRTYERPGGAIVAVDPDSLETQNVMEGAEKTYPVPVRLDPYGHPVQVVQMTADQFRSEYPLLPEKVQKSETVQILKRLLKPPQLPTLPVSNFQPQGSGEMFGGTPGGTNIFGGGTNAPAAPRPRRLVLRNGRAVFE